MLAQTFKEIHDNSDRMNIIAFLLTEVKHSWVADDCEYINIRFVDGTSVRVDSYSIDSIGTQDSKIIVVS